MDILFIILIIYLAGGALYRMPPMFFHRPRPFWFGGPRHHRGPMSGPGMHGFNHGPRGPRR